MLHNDAKIILITIFISIICEIFFKISSNYDYFILNNILKTNNQDWQVNLKIINCHTNKVVAEGTLPRDTIKYGGLEWNNSY